MVIINAVKNDLIGIMTDGFIPEFNILRNRYKQSLKNINKKIDLRIEECKTLEKLTRYKTISEKGYLCFYNSFTHFLQQDICPIKISVVHPCYQTFYDRNINKVEDFMSWDPNLRKYIPILQNEYKFDTVKENKHNIQNLSIFSLNPKHHCCNMIECFQHTLESTGFIIKEKKEYKSYDTFRKIWIKILNECLASFKLW